ncbi:MAG: hypothetical protein PHY40_00880 [Patescibacteria group bacterium]|nr:hypothetical protein [Patescibacteria group bacterium]
MFGLTFVPTIVLCAKKQSASLFKNLKVSIDNIKDIKTGTELIIIYFAKNKPGALAVIPTNVCKIMKKTNFDVFVNVIYLNRDEDGFSYDYCQFSGEDIDEYEIIKVYGKEKWMLTRSPTVEIVYNIRNKTFSLYNLILQDDSENGCASVMLIKNTVRRDVPISQVDTSLVGYDLSCLRKRVKKIAEKFGHNP